MNPPLSALTQSSGGWRVLEVGRDLGAGGFEKDGESVSEFSRGAQCFHCAGQFQHRDTPLSVAGWRRVCPHACFCLWTVME